MSINASKLPEVVRIIIISILKMRKLRVIKFIQYMQGHLTRKPKRSDSNPRTYTPTCCKLLLLQE